MNSVLLFNTMTEAIKAKRLLASNKIKAVSVKLDRTVRGAGCVNGLYIKHKEYFSAIDILKRADISYTVRGDDIS